MFMNKKSTRKEEYSITGDKIVKTIKDLVREGNARKIIIKTEKGETMLEIPLTFGLIGTLIAPPLAAAGALGALVAKCTIVVVRDKSTKKSK